MARHDAQVRASGETGAQVKAATRLARRFARQRDGNIAILFVFMLGVMMLFVGGAVDFTRYNTVRADMIESMDAAGLAMAQIDALNGLEIRDLSGEAREEYLKEQGRRFFYENFKHANWVEDLDVDFDLTTQRIMPRTNGRLKTLFLGVGGMLMFGKEDNNLAYLNMAADTAVVRRDDGNIEVAMVMDVTGSMAGQRIIDLRAAAKEMVDIVVREDQSEWYSKVALIPYSMGVNAGGYASQVRGPIPGPIAITNATWKTGAGKDITNVEKLNPVRITANSHGFANGDKVGIAGVQRSGGSGSCRLECQINNKAYTVTGVTANTFQLQGVDGTSWSGNYSGSTSDFATKCLDSSSCRIRVTAPAHGFETDNRIHVTGVSGMSAHSNITPAPNPINNSVTNTSLADDVWQVTKINNDNFWLNGSVGPNYTDYTSGGSIYCTTVGCEFYYFTNISGNARAFRVTSCVSERVGANQYTDAAPSTTYVGRLYKGTENDCPAAPIIPLSTNKAALKASIDTYAAAGSTAGQIGMAWGWYLLSPNFGYLFAEESRPASYDDDKTTKVAVLMTDGEFNTPYRNGVIAQDATTGSGSNAFKINLNSSNGDPYVQSQNLCTGMKNAGVIVYTIGFDISFSTDVTNLLNNCASGPDYVYYAATGDELKDIYRQIGSEITKLHISK